MFDMFAQTYPWSCCVGIVFILLLFSVRFLMFNVNISIKHVVQARDDVCDASRVFFNLSKWLQACERDCKDVTWKICFKHEKKLMFFVFDFFIYLVTDDGWWTIAIIITVIIVIAVTVVACLALRVHVVICHIFFRVFVVISSIGGHVTFLGDGACLILKGKGFFGLFCFWVTLTFCHLR